MAKDSSLAEPPINKSSMQSISAILPIALILAFMGFSEYPLDLSNVTLASVALGIVVGFVAYLWKGNFTLGLVLGLAMLGNMLVAGMFGAGVPLLLRHLKMDPAVSSAVFVTTFTDVIGFVLFLGLAAAFIDHLV